MERVTKLNKSNIYASNTTSFSTPSSNIVNAGIKNVLEMKNVFGDRNGSFLSLNIVGDNNLILSSSSSNNVQLWSLEGTL